MDRTGAHVHAHEDADAHEEEHETDVYEDVDVDVGTVFNADEDPDLRVDARGQEHEAIFTKMDAGRERMQMWIEAWVLMRTVILIKSVVLGA